MASPVSSIPSVSSVHGKEDKKKRKSLFPGTTRIWLDGQLVTSGAGSVLWLTIFGLTVPSIAVLIFLRAKILEVFSWWIFIPWIGLLLVVISSALMAALTDPGILPRGINPLSEIRMNGSTDYGGEPVSLLHYHPNCPTILIGKEITVNGKSYFVKYCGTCQIFRPPRASHCSFCDNCVEEFDHHCPWLSNCIGRRNLRDFMVFLVSLSLLLNSSIAIFLYIAYKTRTDPDRWQTMFTNWQLDAILVICLMASAMQYTMCRSLHLLANDKTTSEDIKGYVVDTGRTCGSNFGRVFCARRPTRHVAWRDFRSNVRVDKK